MSGFRMLIFRRSYVGPDLANTHRAKHSARGPLVPAFHRITSTARVDTSLAAGRVVVGRALPHPQNENHTYSTELLDKRYKVLNTVPAIEKDHSRCWPLMV